MLTTFSLCTHIIGRFRPDLAILADRCYDARRWVPLLPHQLFPVGGARGQAPLPWWHDFADHVAAAHRVPGIHRDMAGAPGCP